MRAVIQRVSNASVRVNDESVSSIQNGLLVYLGVAPDDTGDDIQYLVQKVAHLRIFQDSQGKMNLDVQTAGGAVLVVSAFTTLCDARKGRRPSFDTAAGPEHAEPMYEKFCKTLENTGICVERGVFREYMEVESVNDGPICVLLDSRRLF